MQRIHQICCRVSILGVTAIVISGLVSCGPSTGAGLGVLARKLHSIDDTLNIRIRDATAAGDFYVEKAGRELRLAVKGMLFELESREGRFFRSLDDLGTQAVLQLEEEVRALDELAGQAVDLEELAYLDAQNLLNQILPDLHVVSSLRGFSQAASHGGEPHRFAIYGSMFQVGNDARYEVTVGDYTPHDLRVHRAGVLEFSVPAAELATAFRDTEAVRLPFRIAVDHRAPKKWFRSDRPWKTVYEYSDQEGILLWPRYPVQAIVEEIRAEQAVDLETVADLTTTKRVPASGKSCKNSDHSCDRSCVVCETVCLDLPAGSQLVEAVATKTHGRWAEVKSHNIGSKKTGTICGKVANWKKSGGASFTYTLRFHPPRERPSVRQIEPIPVLDVDSTISEQARAGWLRFDTDYQVEFDARNFRSFTLKMRLFTGEPIVVTKGGGHPRVQFAPDFGGPTYKRLGFRVRSQAQRL